MQFEQLPNEGTQITSNDYQASYKAGVFTRLAIDEVHCCSQWGHDFRPDYKFLGVMKSLFPNVPILGLTATSSAQVGTLQWMICCALLQLS